MAEMYIVMCVCVCVCGGGGGGDQFEKTSYCMTIR